MGAKYHTIHHTDYKCNYGQFFVFCDYFWGTLWTESKCGSSPGISNSDLKGLDKSEKSK